MLLKNIKLIVNKNVDEDLQNNEFQNSDLKYIYLIVRPISHSHHQSKIIYIIKTLLPRRNESPLYNEMFPSSGSNFLLILSHSLKTNMTDLLL